MIENKEKQGSFKFLIIYDSKKITENTFYSSNNVHIKFPTEQGTIFGEVIIYPQDLGTLKKNFILSKMKNIPPKIKYLGEGKYELTKEITLQNIEKLVEEKFKKSLEFYVKRMFHSVSWILFAPKLNENLVFEEMASKKLIPKRLNPLPEKILNYTINSINHFLNMEEYEKSPKAKIDIYRMIKSEN